MLGTTRHWPSHWRSCLCGGECICKEAVVEEVMLVYSMCYIGCCTLRCTLMGSKKNKQCSEYNRMYNVLMHSWPFQYSLLVQNWPGFWLGISGYRCCPHFPQHCLPCLPCLQMYDCLWTLQLWYMGVPSERMSPWAKYPWIDWLVCQEVLTQLSEFISKTS